MLKKIKRLIEIKELEILKLEAFLRNNTLNQGSKSQIEDKIALKEEILHELIGILPK